MLRNDEGDIPVSGLMKDSARFLMEKVSRAMDDYEIRPSQMELMDACSGNIEAGGVLMAEAGTGTGKTFAYLIPVILSGKKAVVSTKTINLQEQLVSKDLKFLSELRDFSYAIAKGRGNYLCLRRLNSFRAEDQQDAEELGKMMVRASDTATGDLKDLDIRSIRIWDKICSDSDACKGMKCAYYRKCFYFRARQRWEKAQILVANHALVGINSMLPETARILPEAGVLIVDEAHALDQVLSEVIGSTLSNRGFEKILRRLLRMDERGHYKGLLSKSPHMFTAIESLRSGMGLLWTILRREFKDRETVRRDFEFSDMATGISEEIHSLIAAIRTSATGLFEEDEEVELIASMMKLKAFSEGLDEFSHESDGRVRWIEIESDKISLRIAPIYPGDFVRGSIVPGYKSVILTSATLSVGGDFSFISQVLSLKDAHTLSLQSPFDLKSQVDVEIKRGIDLKKEEGVEKLSKAVVEEASKKDGGMLVLFTSRDVMKNTWELCSDELRDIGFNAMIQGEQSGREMLRTMRESENSVIFGLDSFWEGVDVKGDSLKCLIITKLPFEVPSEPVAMARTEMIEREGGNAFYEYSLPRAVLKFKQGFGRLIRSKADRGRIIICDERIETKAYGRVFKKSLW